MILTVGNEMDLDAEVVKAAKLYIQQALDFDYYLAGKFPKDTNCFFDEIVATIEKSLTDEDREKHRGYAQGIVRDVNHQPPDAAIAKSKLASLLTYAVEKIRAKSYIKNRFENSLLLSKFPELKASMDDDGLLPVSIFDEIYPDVYVYKGFAIDPCESTPFDLTKSLTEIASQNKHQVKVRLSHYRIIPKKDYLPTMREAHIWGKPFDPSTVYKRLFEPNLTTVFERHPKTELERNYQCLLAKVVRFEVNRHEDRDRIVISAETLVPIATRHEKSGYVKTKLFHSDVLIGQQLFNHIDVSCLVYTLEQYRRRLLVKMPVKVKAKGHYKLFWLGAGNISTWIELIQRTYPSNELVQEYLTGEDWSLENSA
jgi:hypothetical protein